MDVRSGLHCPPGGPVPGPCGHRGRGSSIYLRGPRQGLGHAPHRYSPIFTGMPIIPPGQTKAMTLNEFLFDLCWRRLFEPFARSLPSGPIMITGPSIAAAAQAGSGEMKRSALSFPASTDPMTSAWGVLLAHPDLAGKLAIAGELHRAFEIPNRPRRRARPAQPRRSPVPAFHRSQHAICARFRLSPSSIAVQGADQGGHSWELRGPNHQ